MTQELQFSVEGQANFLNYNGQDYISDASVEFMPTSFTKNGDPIEVTDAEATIVEDKSFIVRVDTDDTIVGDGSVVFQAVIGNEYMVGFIGPIARPPHRPL